MAVPNRAVLDKDEAQQRVVSYSPRQFPFHAGQAAHEFVKFQSQQENPDFHIDRVVSQTSGIAELERQSLSERVEAEALTRLKALQEEAYAQGYDLGRDEGRESAYREKLKELDDRLKGLDLCVAHLESIKENLVRSHESQLVRLAFEVARRLMLDEVEQNPQRILPVILAAAGEAAQEETLTIRLSERDFAFVEDCKAKVGKELPKEFEFLKKAKLESSRDVADGGCIVETNFGQVDASVQMRVERMWSSLKDRLPKTADRHEVKGEDE